MTTPTVSIVMPCFNAERFLSRSIGSVLAQTFTDWELIAVDDGSTDGTLEQLYAHARTDPRIRVISQPNHGVSIARNEGLKAARGKYIAFLDADDTWESNFLQRMHTALVSRSDVVLAYCGWQNLGLPGNRGTPFIPPDYETPEKLERLLSGCRWPIHAVLTQRKTILAAGAFDPRLQVAEDFLLWLRIATTGPILRVPEVLAYYHFHDGEQATTKADRAALQLLQAQRIFLADHPEIVERLGKRRIRELILAPLLHRGYECYWERDLAAARRIFHEVMKHGYGALLDWKYMLPSLLPFAWHQWIIQRFSSHEHARGI